MIIHGALLVDKPAGPTSHDVVAFARRALKTRAIGHTGTLDPLATGLLVLLVGHATRLARFLVTDEKEYLADVRLGQSTPTYDAQGLDAGGAMRDAGGAAIETGESRREVESEAGGGRREVRVTPEQIRSVLPDFLGTFPQLPPPFSAKKVAGVRAYEKARKNETVELKPVEVTVRELELLPAPPPASRLAPPDHDPTLLRLRVVCSAGFYVRSLAHDIGKVLGCGAHLEALRRTRAGSFDVADAWTLEAIEAAGEAGATRLVSLNTLLAGMPAVSLTDEGNRRAWNGNTLAPAHLLGPATGPSGQARVRVLSPSGEVLAVAERRSDGLLHPLVVLR
jgi:tRNA pseudouridine55 synthase